MKYAQRSLFPNALRSTLALFLLLFMAGCTASEPRVSFKGEEFTVSLAKTREQQLRGLMFVEELPADEGMLFIFPREALRAFWMKNTKIPLDIFYFDDELRLVSVAENARPCVADPCPTYPSTGPARYVLELNAGMARSLGAERGDPLTLLFEP
ncbi:MAG: DUF192 domain-containing protein [Pseudomonadota bacterium]